jgi:hypothetical protein
MKRLWQLGRRRSTTLRDILAGHTPREVKKVAAEEVLVGFGANELGQLGSNLDSHDEHNTSTSDVCVEYVKLGPHAESLEKETFGLFKNEVNSKREHAAQFAYKRLSSISCGIAHAGVASDSGEAAFWGLLFRFRSHSLSRCC